jgi:putative ABC transport system permease protein
MKSKTLVKLAVQSIQKNKMRAALTMLGIIIGVAAVLVMVGVGYGARTRIRQQINNLGTNMIVITPGAAQAGGVSQGAQAFPNLSLGDVEKIRGEAQLVSAVSPVIVSRAPVIGAGGNWRTLINGVDTDYQTIRDWQTSSGDFFTADDVQSNRKVVLLGTTVAQNLFPGQDPVGAEIQIRSSVFTVTGVLAPKGQTASGSDSDDVVLMPYTTASQTLSGRSFIPQILASTENERDIPAAQEEIRAILRESHRIDSVTGGGVDDFTVRNQADLASAAESSTQVMTLLLAAIASISLLVGGIGIMNIMLVSVTERTREIGIRMAIGARGSDVLTQFLVESVVMGVLGGLVGLALGYTGAKILGHFTGWETVISPLFMLVSVGFSGAVGVFFGYYPARKAAALRPIEALRYE